MFKLIGPCKWFEEGNIMEFIRTGMLFLKKKQKPWTPNTVTPASGGSSPSDKGGGGVGVSQKFIWPFGPQSGLQIRGGSGPPVPLP